MRVDEVHEAILKGREVTMPGGRLAVLLAECPSCKVERDHRCVNATWSEHPVSNQVHAPRRRLAAERWLAGAR